MPTENEYVNNLFQETEMPNENETFNENNNEKIANRDFPRNRIRTALCA